MSPGLDLHGEKQFSFTSKYKENDIVYNIEFTVLALEKCFRRHTFENLD